MKTRMIVGTLVFFIFLGLGSTVQNTQGHCFWDVFVVPWTSVGDYKVSAGLDVRYNACAKPGYYSRSASARVTAHGNTYGHPVTIWAHLTHEPGEDADGTTGEFKVRASTNPWDETKRAWTIPTSRDLLRD